MTNELNMNFKSYKKMKAPEPRLNKKCHKSSNTYNLIVNKANSTLNSN